MCVFLLALFTFIISACGIEETANQREFTIEETYKIKAGVSETSSLVVLLPVSYAYQKVANIKVDGADTYDMEEVTDNLSILRVQISGTGQERVIRISYDITLERGKLEWDYENREKNALPETLIESDDPQVIKIADSLVDDQNEYKTAKNIAHYVSSTIKFDYSEKINIERQTAVKTLTDKKGICADYANLMVAMLRATGISARSISGIALADLGKIQDWGHQGGSHAWVEFFVDGKWHFAEPTWGDSYFDNSDGYHLSYGDTGIESELYNKELNIFLANESYTIIGSMSAPLKFILASTDKNGTVLPSAKVNKR